MKNLSRVLYLSSEEHALGCWSWELGLFQVESLDLNSQNSQLTCPAHRYHLPFTELPPQSPVELI